ncbi:hypothetical protein AOL_s00081g203 [Orbilia oligospora ATCC 24927]|uniref:Uncharacterized protein n=1 Tax=Arthrobotrys oligospora (strain ATCC 24927 / CBS 115.81 / DSM 1491) TaxID=756982 RepID=G1XFR0_ARTOA|nr:hypothetical protein AOL_s00081g203 [Orbilia oligospora ATCC 24927]EGX47876.1 hypothetical protein AOL_s00081g203 [Orbilia oligospora ATCC 24927]
MSDSTPEVPEATTPSDASLAQMTPLSVSEQARIRRELRKAKVGQGADRLRKITQTQRSAAGFQEDYKGDDVEISPSPAPRATVENISDQELDVSEHFYQPNNRPRDVPNRILPPTPPSQSEFSLDEEQLAQMMQAGGLFGAPPPQPGASPFGAGPPQGMESDPLLQMMQQMLGGAGGMPGMPPPGTGPGAGGAGAGGLPPDLLSAMLGGAAGPEQPAPQESPYTKWWAFLHILCSVLLGVYAVLSLPQRYTGTKEERIQHEGAQKIVSDFMSLKHSFSSGGIGLLTWYIAVILVLCYYGVASTVHSLSTSRERRPTPRDHSNNHLSISPSPTRNRFDHFFALHQVVFNNMAGCTDSGIHYWVFCMG